MLEEAYGTKVEIEFTVSSIIEYALMAYEVNWYDIHKILEEAYGTKI